MIRLLCFLSFSVLFFSNWPGLAVQIQILGVLLFVMAAAVSLLTGQARKEELTIVELLWLVATFSSFLASIVSGSMNVFIMTLVGSAAFLSVSILRRTMCFDELARICAYSFCIIIPIVIVIDPSAFLSGISAEWESGVGLLRFRPLGLHPNLTGFVFGFGAILTLYFFYVTTDRKKYVFLLTSFFCLIFVLAASARAGLVAIAVTFFVVMTLRVRQEMIAKYIKFFSVALVLVLLAPVLLADFSIISLYFVNILDLDSETRGVGSGGTGRLDLWMLSINELKARGFFELLFGTGFRSSSEESIGYSTESSYFTLMLENGLVIAITFFLHTISWAGRLIRRAEDERSVSLLIGGLIVFVCIQSIFNRYMIAFGNPVSLLMLAAFFGVGKFTRVRLH